MYPLASFTLSKKGKDEFSSMLAAMKVLNDYAVNIKYYGLKGHEHHIIINHLLPLVTRKMKHKNLGAILIELSTTFKYTCSNDTITEDVKSFKKSYCSCIMSVSCISNYI